MSTIRLYRKVTNDPSRKPTKAQWDNVLHALALSRTRRPELEAFFRTGGFAKLKPLRAEVVKDPGVRRRDHLGSEFCYVLTGTDLGRAKTRPETVAMAVRQWIERYLVATGVIGHDEFAIAVDPE